MISSDSKTSNLLPELNGLENWRDHPDLNPTFYFPSWVVPVAGKTIHTLLNIPSLQPYLANQLDLLRGQHLRFKLVLDFPPETHANGSKESDRNVREKLVLLRPDTPTMSALPELVQQLLRDCLVDRQGPTIPVKFCYNQFSASYILTKVLPPHAHPPPAAFETIGHIAHLNLRERHLPYRHVIGQVLLETLPAIETVITKAGDVAGPHRTYEFEVVAGRPGTDVQLTESSIQLHFDVAEVYWCSRLSEERKRLLRDEFRPYQTVADAFCGVGAICLMAAKELNCTIWANDWNPKAIASLRENAAVNGVAGRFKSIQSVDAYNFLMDLGLVNADGEDQTTGRAPGSIGTKHLPDHVILNIPLQAPEFLGALRWWSAPQPQQRRRIDNRKDDEHEGTRVHVYTFARADPETDRSAEDVAVDLVASNLLPLGDRVVVNRLNELNKDYGCRVKVHHVRDVAPGKLVVCVSFTATPKLLSHMQGDFR
jgi:tRNA (guanine37-N1)-methyltransferase